MQLSQVLIKHILGRICKTNTLQVLNVNILLHVLHMYMYMYVYCKKYFAKPMNKKIFYVTLECIDCFIIL